MSLRGYYMIMVPPSPGGHVSGTKQVSLMHDGSIRFGIYIVEMMMLRAMSSPVAAKDV